MSSNGDSQGEGVVAFERARLEYCRRVFEREEERRQELERKSQFYLSFITLVLGAVFLKPDSLSAIGDTLTSGQIPAAAARILTASMAILGFALLFATIAILAAVAVRKYRGEYPSNMADALFSPESDYLEEQSEAHMMRVSAMNYAVALQDNRAQNDLKAAWLSLGAAGVVATVVSLAILLGTVTVLTVIR